MQFDGAVNSILDLFFRGEVTLTSPSVRRVAEFFDIKFAEIGNFEEWSVKGNIEGVLNNILITNGEYALAGNQAEGVLSINYDELGMTNIDGTLAFAQLDFETLKTQFFSNVTRPDRANAFDSLNMDIRVSCTEDRNKFY